MAELFSKAEYDGRVAAVRREMEARDLDLLILAAPENVFYLTGLHDWGYFAPVLLVVPTDGDMVVVTRANKATTVEHQVTGARFEGHSDSETPADGVGRLVRAIVPRPLRVGLEMWSSGLSPGLARALEALLDRARWEDVTGLVDRLRHVTSGAEQHYIRRAARLSDAAMAVAIDAVEEGASEAEVAAACQQVITAGGTFPGFGPFVRSSPRLTEEHSTWTDARLRDGDAVLFELSGCIGRYHAPLGRLVHVGHAPDDAYGMAAVAHDAFHAALGKLRDGSLARDVYASWQRVLDEAGLDSYRRHHCGYLVGIGIPPSWMGGNRATGLRHDSDLAIRTGMAFHVHSWLVGTGHGDFFLSNTVLVGDAGPEVLTRTPSAVSVR